MPKSHCLLLSVLLGPISSSLLMAAGSPLPFLVGEQASPTVSLGARQMADELGVASGPAHFSAGRLPAGGDLDIRDAVAIAVGRHPSIASAAAAISQQEGQVSYAEAGYYPKISAGVSGGRTSTYGNSQVATVSISQMLYDFGKVGGSVEQAKGLVFKQQALLLKQIDNVAQDTALTVLEVHRYQSLQKIAQDQVKAVQNVLEMVKLRADSGLTSQSDYVQATTRVQSAEANQQQVTSLLAQARARLVTLVGSPLPARVAEMPIDLETSAQLNAPLNYASLPEVLAAEAERKSAYGALQNAKAQRYPTLALEASANQALSGTNPSNGEKEGRYNTLMLTGNALLYQGGVVSAQIASALAGIEKAEATINEARLAAEDALSRAQEQAGGARMRQNILGQRMLSIDETRALYREQYTVGTRSVLDLLNAEQERYQAAADQEAARHDFWQGLINYIGAAGRSREAYQLNNTSIQQIEIKQ